MIAILRLISNTAGLSLAGLAGYTPLVAGAAAITIIGAFAAAARAVPTGGSGCVPSRKATVKEPGGADRGATR